MHVKNYFCFIKTSEKLIKRRKKIEIVSQIELAFGFII